MKERSNKSDRMIFARTIATITHIILRTAILIDNLRTGPANALASLPQAPSRLIDHDDLPTARV